ncbi:MAG: hypothetical protein H6883_04295 [Rhodobiaceae bacterium]|nr:hypothetical protein [Rhodobiaceae bacterium]MCC0055336.1 hypothetical protein [Rhodobiaceae bacterium]
MADRTLDGLRACITSLNTIVGPAVDKSGDTLAREQVALMAKYLDFLVDRLDYAEDRSRFELGAYADMADEIATCLSGGSVSDAELDERRGLARTLLSGGAGKGRLESASGDLQASISRVVRALGEQDHPLRTQVDRIVIRHSNAVVSLQRAWFAPQAWEAAGVTVPDIDEVLGTGRKA